jgi:RNase P subunit RPR2
VAEQEHGVAEQERCICGKCKKPLFDILFAYKEGTFCRCKDTPLEEHGVAEQDDIVFNCFKCDTPIIRNSNEHDESRCEEDDNWYCPDCGFEERITIEWNEFVYMFLDNDKKAIKKYDKFRLEQEGIVYVYLLYKPNLDDENRRKTECSFLWRCEDDDEDNWKLMKYNGSSEFAMWWVCLK